MEAEDQKIIKDNPIGKGLDAFRARFKSVCKDPGGEIPEALDQIDHEALRLLTRDLLLALARLPVARLLPSSGGGVDLTDDLLKLRPSVSSSDYNSFRNKPLLEVALAENPDDALIWSEVRNAVATVTPPRPESSSFQSGPGTPPSHSMSGLVNSSGRRENVDIVLKNELGVMYVGIPNFYERFFGNVADLEPASRAFYERCTEGSCPRFSRDRGWRGWSADAHEEKALSWLGELFAEVAVFAKDFKPTPTSRILAAEPGKRIDGSNAFRTIDAAFVEGPEACAYDWKQVLVPGELKRDEDMDKPAGLDLARSVREVFAAQDSRRFVLGFTLCGSLLRIWEFDRLGGTASEPFNIQEDGRRLVSVILGFLWMNDKELGYDPTITTEGKQRFITINREGLNERLVIDELMTRAACIAGRATTCWKVHREGDSKPFVVKDSWQYIEREAEGKMLQDAASNGVTNVARYYHHETVFVDEKPDEVLGNIRVNLEIAKAEKYPPRGSDPSPGSNLVDSTSKGSSHSATGQKRPGSYDDASPAASKRYRSASSTNAGSGGLQKREHRRVVLSSYGKAIYEASSRSALLAAVEGCIEGHKSLREGGFLHRDISINNLIINENGAEPTSFLIDLDLAIREDRITASGAKGRTGTKVFMAIGVLRGEQHSFMHDLESFFWVLFWICIHYNGPGTKPRIIRYYDGWDFYPVEVLAAIKYAAVSSVEDFSRHTTKFTKYYKPLAPWMNKLREVVFLDGRPRKEEDARLYSQMTEILDEARKAVMAWEGGSNTHA